MANIHLPKNTEGIIGLARSIVNKYDEDLQTDLIGAGDVELLRSALQAIVPKHTEMLALRKRTTELNLEIQTVLGTHNMNHKLTPGTVRFVIARVRDILKGKCRENPDDLRNWGFCVDGVPGLIKEKLP
jgi:hypothetical protein